jgi:hypothetical protein
MVERVESLCNSEAAEKATSNGTADDGAIVDVIVVRDNILVSEYSQAHRVLRRIRAP